MTSSRIIAFVAFVVCATGTVPSATSVTQASEFNEPRLIKSFHVEPDVEFLAWNADESKIATAGQLDRVVEVWNWRDKKKLAHLMKPGLGGGSMSFAGDKIITSPLSMDPGEALTLWDFQGNKTESVPMSVPPQRREAESFDVSASGNRLAMLRTARRAVVFETATWHPIADIDGLKAAVVALSPNSEELATANYDGTISIYDVGSGTLRLNFRASPDDPSSMAWAPDGRTIAWGEAASRPRMNQTTGKIENSNHRAWIRLFDPDTGRMISETKVDIGLFQVKFLAFSKDSARLVSNQQDGVLRVWDAKDLTFVGNISTRGNADFFSFSPSGRHLAVSRRDSVLIFEWP